MMSFKSILKLEGRFNFKSTIVFKKWLKSLKLGEEREKET